MLELLFYGIVSVITIQYIYFRWFSDDAPNDHNCDEHKWILDDANHLKCKNCGLRLS